MNQLLVWSLERARQHTQNLMRDVTPEMGCRQSFEGEHHPVWILGHLLLGDTYLLHLLGVEPLSPDFAGLLDRYGPGAAPVASPDRYDRSDRLLERLTSAGRRRTTAIGAMSPARLDQATPDPVLAGSQPTIAHHLQALLCHEGYHAGQLAAWRRAHRLDPTRWAFAPGES